ncbi:hypothetical protein BSFA1_75900 (plasmid) [Burkholderia sp. SFA1]|nr:hypothetical protein BSFA1_75900 [Burkholderia sp. SFA1]
MRDGVDDVGYRCLPVTEGVDRLRCGLGVLLTLSGRMTQHLREVGALDLNRAIDKLAANPADRAAGRFRRFVRQEASNGFARGQARILRAECRQFVGARRRRQLGQMGGGVRRGGGQTRFHARQFSEKTRLLIDW